MRNDTPVEVTLSRNSFGQILDALFVLVEEWRETAVFHEYGACHDDAIIRECSGTAEARNMQRIYQELIDELSSQLPKKESRR
ncbi:hypothetical protein [Planctomicrobium piriforme]|uniref:hypothetical protein n=1 Tax=Planctomicrobium piriforme TaxID=1576369 RepID=UPI001113B1D7|nr:hypothetical protein [Planctomicrobium piriforme]